MPRSIIEVKSLSKKYNISHQRSYLTLRDTLASYFKKPFEILKSKAQKLPLSLKEDFWALKDMSFNIQQGEVVGIIGRNGAGKTTLLKILSRITYPTKGQINMQGRVGSLLEVGTGFHPELTGRENIYFNGAILGMKKREIDKRFDEIVDFSGVEKFLDTPVKRFSSGMQVRLAFSVAAYLEPEILLVDEVLAVGDVQFQQKCLGKMKDVSQGGRTILFVSHNMSAIHSLCNRTILLENGKLALDADSATVIAKYLEQNLSTAAVISGKELESKMEGVINRANPFIRLRKVTASTLDDTPTSTFNSDEVIKISMEYECFTVVGELRLHINLVDEENRIILITQNIDNAVELEHSQKNPGVYKSFCLIPPNTFGEKRFFVSVHLEYPKVEHLVFDRVLVFDVTFDGFNNFPGSSKNSFLRPLLEWNTEVIRSS